tara:strand:+ start:450 stop:581 length:132 start_codon:yes stop_codon:yes gene_type:complete
VVDLEVINHLLKMEPNPVDMEEMLSLTVLVNLVDQVSLLSVTK